MNIPVRRSKCSLSEPSQDFKYFLDGSSLHVGTGVAMPCLPLLRSSKDSKGDADTEHAFEASPGQQLQSKGTRMPCVYVNHGGGPMPLLGQQPDLAAYLSGYAAQLPAKPTAIVIVTAHWEEQIPT
eukprot:3402262-Amphidinium_carterae.1